MIRCLIALALLLPVAVAEPLTTDGRWIRDAQGRVVILRGANASQVAKRPPFEPALAADGARLWPRLGFSVVRLLVLWEAVEPTRGRVDAAYLDRLAGHVDRYHAAGVQVVLDMHQDLWSRHHLGGDGAPDWATVRRPFRRLRPWFANYLTPAVRANFDRFWSSPALQADYARAWEAVAGRLGGHPAVVGFDLMNEPYPGTARVGRFEAERFVDWTRRLAERLERAAPGRLTFFEPVVTNPTAVQHYRSLARPGRVFAPHWYDPLPKAPLLTRLALPALDRRTRAAGLPLWLGEIGVEQRLPGAADWATSTCDRLDRMMVGWAWWAWDRGDGRGFDLLDAVGRPTPLARRLARPYPTRIAGDPLGWRWQPGPGRFTLRWRPTPGGAAPTVVMTPPAALGPAGGRVIVRRGVARVERDPRGHRLRVWAAAGAATCELVVQR